MTSFTRPALAAISLALGLAWPLQAQMPSSATQVPAADNWTRDDVPAHLAVLAGAVTLERDGVAKPAELNTVLLAGDQLRTDRGRAEIMFGDGSALDLDYATSAELVSDSLVRLRAGLLRLSITRLSNDVDYRVDAAGSSVRISSAGDFLISLVDSHRLPEIDLAVYRGTAELENAHGRTVVRAGMHAWASEDSTPSTAASFNTSASDDFDAWVDSQRSAQVSSASSSYLPSEMRGYGGSLDTSGTWQNDATYGEVWYPQVDSGWQPYSDGYWSSVGGYGWFWVGQTPWSWPTHHYGRWGNASGRWFWVPGRQWGPGWVTWSRTPGFVGWCPIGPTPVDRHATAGFSPAPLPEMRRGWTTVPLQQFGHAGMPGFPAVPQPAPFTGREATTLPRPGGGPLMPPSPQHAGPALGSPTGTRTRVVPRPEPWSNVQSQLMSGDPGPTGAPESRSPGAGRELHSPSHSSGAPSSFSSSPLSRAPLSSPSRGTVRPQPSRTNVAGDGRGQPPGDRGPAQLPARPPGKPSGDRSDEAFHPGHVPSQWSRPSQSAAPPAGAPAKGAPPTRSAPGGRGGREVGS